LFAIKESKVRTILKKEIDRVNQKKPARGRREGASANQPTGHFHQAAIEIREPKTIQGTSLILVGAPGREEKRGPLQPIGFMVRGLAEGVRAGSVGISVSEGDGR